MKSNERQGNTLKNGITLVSNTTRKNLILQVEKRGTQQIASQRYLLEQQVDRQHNKLFR